MKKITSSGRGHYKSTEVTDFSGKVEYHYWEPGETYGTMGSFPSTPFVQPKHKSGKLKKVSFFNENQVSIKEEEYNYTSTISHNFISNTFRKVQTEIGFADSKGCSDILSCGNAPLPFNAGNGSPDAFLVKGYSIKTGSCLLSDKSAKVNDVEIISTYSYRGDLAHHNPISISSTNSNGQSVEKEISYAQELIDAGSFPWATGLTGNKNMVALPLMTTTSIGGVNNKTGSYVEYENVSGTMLPVKSYVLNEDQNWRLTQSLTYDSNHRVQWIYGFGLPSSGIELKYYANDLVKEVIHPEGQTNFYVYDNFHRLDYVLDQNDIKTGFTYGEFNRLITAGSLYQWSVAV